MVTRPRRQGTQHWLPAHELHWLTAIMACSGINAVGTRAQREQYVRDSVDAFVEDTMKAGRGLCNRDLVEVLGSQSAAAVDFIESFNVKLDVLSQLGGHSAKRTHREANRPDGRPRPIGWDIVSALKQHVEQLADSGMVTIAVNTQVKAMARAGSSYSLHLATTTPGEGSEDAVTSTQDAAFDAVILTTGGYSASPSLLGNHTPHLQDLPTTNGPWAQGEGIALGQQVEATPEHLEYVQVHPTGFVDPTDVDAKTLFLAPEALRGSGGVLLSVHGVRFVNELAPRDVVTGHIWRDSSAEPAEMAEQAGDEEVPVHKQPPTVAWAYLVLDHKAVQAFGSAAFGFYHKAKHFFTEVSGTRGLAAHIAQANAARELHTEVPEAHVRQTFEEYAQAADGLRTDAFGKTVFPNTRYQRVVSHGDHPLFVAMIQPVLHYTMGGLKIDTTGAMLDGNSDAIPGLYGAGEVTAGVHGANRLGGNSLLECVVFGRLAGKHATLYGQQIRQHAEHTEQAEKEQGHDEL